MQPETPRAQRPAGDKFTRKAESTAYDVLEGPFTRTFHRFWRRREISPKQSKPFPWFIGGMHRFARQLDVAATGELFFLGAAPLVVAFFTLWGHLGVPRMLQGYGVLMTCSYFGLFFVVLVFLDRRLDGDDFQRLKAYTDGKRNARDLRLTARSEARLKRKGVDTAAREAVERGRAKAGQAPTTPAAEPPRVRTPALHELLDPH